MIARGRRTPHGPVATTSSLSGLERLRFARQLDKSGPIPRRIPALAFLRPFDHSAERSLSFMLRVAQQHPKLGYGRRELQVRRSILKLRSVVGKRALGQLAGLAVRFLMAP